MDCRLIRAIFALVAAVLVLALPLAAPAQTITSGPFSGLPGSAAPGTLRWVTDGACTPIPGTPEIGGGPHVDLVSYDAVDARWEFISRAPLGTTETDLPTFLEGGRISYDHTASGATADDVQEALDELFAMGGGGGGGATDLGFILSPTTVTVTSDTGADAVIPAATGSDAGMMTAADRTKLAGIASGATVGHGNGTNCGAGLWAGGTDASGNAEGCTADDDVPDASEVPLSSLNATGTRNSTTFLRGDNTFAVPPDDDVPDAGEVVGSAIADATIGVAKLSATGTKNATTFLRGDDTWATPAGGGGGGPTDLSQGSRTTTTVAVNSSTGTSATLSAATNLLAGVMPAVDKARLDSIDDIFCEQFLDGGEDIGKACNDAYADAIATGRGGNLRIGTGSFLQTTPIDLCDESGQGQWKPVVLIGNGTSEANKGVTRLLAASGFASSNIGRTSYTVTANVNLDGSAAALGYDRIQCVGCDFAAAGFKRGDLIETTGFANASNNYGLAATTEIRKSPLKIQQVTATAILVEGEINPGAEMANVTADTGGQIRKLRAQVELCHHGQYVDGIEVNGDLTNRYADIGVHFKPDNKTGDACTAAGQPYAYCTGSRTTDASNRAAVIVGAGVKRATVAYHKFSNVALTAPDTSGQADHFIVEDSTLLNSAVSFWYDSSQAMPFPLVYRSQLTGYDRNGMRIASGSGAIHASTVISSSSTACRDDTYGACVGVTMLSSNTAALDILGTTIENHLGKAISVESQTSAPRVLSIRDSYVSANGTQETSMSLLDVPGLCGVLVNDGNTWANHDSIAAGPTLTISNSNQATCPLSITGRSAFKSYTPGSFALPVLTINNGIPSDLTADAVLPSINGGVPNGSGAKVHWSQLLGVPANTAAGSFLPLAGGTLTGSLTLTSGQAINIPSGAVIQATGTGANFATNYVGSGSISPAVDMGTAEITGLNLVANGGTGVNNLTHGGLVLGTGFGAFRSTGVLAAGQLLIGDGTTDPTIAAMSGDVTMNSGGVASLATGSVDANELVSTGVSPGTYQNANVTVDADGRVTAITAGSSLVIASGTRALATTSIASGACNTDTITAAGVLSTDVVTWSPNADLSAVVGYRPISGDGLAIYPPVPSSGSISVKVCNPTASSITPGAVSLNYRVVR